MKFLSDGVEILKRVPGRGGRAVRAVEQRRLVVEQGVVFGAEGPVRGAEPRGVAKPGGGEGRVDGAGRERRVVEGGLTRRLGNVPRASTTNSSSSAGGNAAPGAGAGLGEALAAAVGRRGGRGGERRLEGREVRGRGVGVVLLGRLVVLLVTVVAQGVVNV